jgi:hypothetical protein
VAAFGDPLLHQTVDALELYSSDDGANVDSLVERRADAERAHARLQFAE